MNARCQRLEDKNNKAVGEAAVSSDLEPVNPIDECVRLSRELAFVQNEYKEMLDEAVVVEGERNKLKRENTALHNAVDSARRSLSKCIFDRWDEAHVENAYFALKAIDDIEESRTNRRNGNTN